MTVLYAACLIWGSICFNQTDRPSAHVPLNQRITIQVFIQVYLFMVIFGACGILSTIAGVILK